MAFKDGEFDDDSELVRLGKHILRKCGYVPLAVIAIGSTLRYRKKDKRERLSFVENELSQALLDDDDDNLMHVLKVSYNDLPLVLKHCFAYCSLFPKDHEFSKDVLVHMWQSQGFVEPYAKKSLEEVGDDYFFHMVDRYFFHEVERHELDIGNVKYTCKMHDLLHDLALQVAGLEFGCAAEDNLRNMAERSGLRHISVTCSLDCSSDYSALSSHSTSLRTFRFIDAEFLEKNCLKIVLQSFTILRTLELPNLSFQKLPDSFGELIHLRYLDISSNDRLTALPDSICKLYHLQTLLLTDCYSLVKLPPNLPKLVSLRHLLLHDCHALDSMPLGFEALTSLVTLDRFILHPRYGGLRCLGSLDDLYGVVKLELPVDGWIDCVEDARKSIMSSKHRLSGMAIIWKDEYKEPKLTREDRLAVLEEIHPHANLQYLEMYGYVSDKLPNWFSSLSNVKELRLKGSSQLEYLDISVRSGYLLPCLESLILEGLNKLKGWWRDENPSRDSDPLSTIQRLPRVSKLFISHCRRLVENMPLFEAVEELILEIVTVRLLNMLLTQRHHYNKLQVLTLDCIDNLKSLPEDSIKHLTALKKLSIVSCKKLSWVSRRGLACLTSLEYLTIRYCENVSLEDEDNDDDERRPMEIKNDYGLQGLRRLAVPWQCHLLRDGLQYLTSLEHLEIPYNEKQQVECDNQDLEGKAMSWKGLEKLRTFLLSFNWMCCCFPLWTLHHPCLEDLTIDECKEINTDDWIVQQTKFQSLFSLTISSYEELSLSWVYDIPWKLFPTLRTLSIDCELDSTIPDEIQHIASLQHLTIMDCGNLKEIPEWMIKLTSLQQLTFYRCSIELSIRCKPETGIDWPLISHVPRIEIRTC